MSDQYQWWRDALAGKNPPVHADHPQSGFFKMRTIKDGPWVPVAIWTDKDVRYCLVGNQQRDAASVWTSCAGRPVPEAAAKTAFRTGQWPGDAPPVTDQQAGSNNPPSDVTELIPLEIDAADEWLSAVKTITTQVDSDIASNKVANLRKLKKDAEVAHEKEKAPHLAAGRAVDKKYNPKIEDAGNAVKRLLAAVTVFQNAEKARLQKIADEAARVENEKRMAEYKRQQDEAAEIAAAKFEEPPKPVAAPDLVTPETVKIKSGGASGKVVGLRKVKFAVIEDYDKALIALKGHKELKELVQKQAHRACKAGVPLDGVKFDEREEAA